MAIPESVLLDIKYKLDIESVIAPYVNLKRRGKNLVGLCPFHGEKTPSFTVYPETASFYCFGCGAGGDIFTFVKLAENLDYIEAVKKLASDAGVTLPENGVDDSIAKLKTRILAINRETARFFHNYLFTDGGKWALDYLTGRGLTLNTIKHFGLGCAPDSWDALQNHLLSCGFTADEMYQAGVVGRNQSGRYYDMFRKRAMFPVIDVRGNVIAFSGRAPAGEENGKKYVNSPDTPVYKKSQNLFGMNFAKNHCSKQLILVEGNMDVITLHQAGFENTVAALGTSFTAEQANLICRYTSEIVLTLDSDAAGRKAAARAMELLKGYGIPVRVISIPDGKDPDEFIKNNGAARFRGILEGAVNDIEYKLLAAADGIDADSPDGKLRYLNAAAQVLALTPDAVARDLYISKLADKYDVSRTAISTKVEELRKKITTTENKKQIQNVITPRFSRDDVNPEKFRNQKAAKAEEIILSLLLQHPDLYETCIENISPDKFITSLNRRIFEAFISQLESGRSIEISLLGEEFSPSEIGYIVSLQHSDSLGSSPKTVLSDCIRVILEENMTASFRDKTDISAEDWAEAMKKIANSKNKGE